MQYNCTDLKRKFYKTRHNLDKQTVSEKKNTWHSILKGHLGDNATLFRNTYSLLRSRGQIASYYEI